MILNYSLSELSNDCQNSNVLNFDNILLQVWGKLQKTPDVFSYSLTIRNERIVEGKYGFVLQLNPERATKRRMPDKLVSLKQKFNPASFNFTKISEKEQIMQIKNENKDTSRDLIIINASPICFGHSLICPEIEKCLPQVITLRSLQLLMEIMFLTNNRYLRLGFNSLCAMASVNHLHYHIIILEYELPVETVKCDHLIGPIYTIHEDYPARGFCFQLKSKFEIEKVALDVYKLTSYLTDKNIAHNVFAMRGESLDGSVEKVWRIFVWARDNSEGVKEFDSINVAICEFAGHFPLKNDCEFEMSEDEFAKLISGATRKTFEGIVMDVAKLFS